MAHGYGVSGMDLGILANTIIVCLLTIIVFMFKSLTSKLEDHIKEYNNFRAIVATNYITKQDLSDRIERLCVKVDRLFDTLLSLKETKND